MDFTERFHCYGSGMTKHAIKKAPHVNLWVEIGEGRFSSVCNNAISAHHKRTRTISLFGGEFGFVV